MPVGHHRVQLVALDVLRALLMDCFSCGRYHPAPRVVGHDHLFVFPPSLVGVELGCVCGMATVTRGCPAADLKLLLTKGHDKPGVGVT
jgi:hypothetical protein